MISVRRKKSLKKIYRITIDLVLIFFLSIVSYNYINQSLNIKKEYELNYAENSNVDYTVCLKENEFYDDKCLSKDMKYVASLIDKINLNINYSFSTDQFINSSYNYSVIGKIIISDPDDDKNVIYTKNYTLANEITDSVTNGKIINVSQVVALNYNEYNSIANKFKTTYGVSSNARLEVHLLVNNSITTADEKKLSFEKDADLLISIPLSENSINIEIDYAKIANNDSFSTQSNNVIGNYPLLIIGSIFGILVLFLIVRFIRFIESAYNNKTKYDKELNRLLKEYDRLIVESQTILNIDDYTIIKVKKFEELVDVHDNIKQPIIFNEIKQKELCWFYIKENEDLFLYVLNATELEE